MPAKESLFNLNCSSSESAFVLGRKPKILYPSAYKAVLGMIERKFDHYGLLTVV
jgi:hypothetical protein